MAVRITYSPPVKTPLILGFGGFFCFSVHLRVHLIITRDKNVLIRSYLSGVVFTCWASISPSFLVKAYFAEMPHAVRFRPLKEM